MHHAVKKNSLFSLIRNYYSRYVDNTLVTYIGVGAATYYYGIRYGPLSKYESERDSEMYAAGIVLASVGWPVGIPLYAINSIIKYTDMKLIKYNKDQNKN